MKPLHIFPCMIAAGGALWETKRVRTPRKSAVRDIQRVPLSIVAYGGEALAEVGAQNFSSLAARVPG
jgi:hypothetical protein